MNIELKDKNGITLKTAGKYCSSDVGIIPKLQSKSVAANGSVVADEGYCGLDSVTVAVPATPTQEKTVDLAMASGNQTITPTSGKVLSQVVVKKPATMLPENIKKDVNIGGVTGTLESGGGGELNIAYGDTAPEDTSKLWIKSEEPSNISFPVVWKPEQIVEGVTDTGTTLPTAASGIGTAAVGTKIYLFGGYYNTIQVFDTTNNTIQTLSTTLPIAAGDIGTAAVGTKIYLFGGYSSSDGYLKTIQVFDTTNNTIQTLSTTLPQGLSAMGTAAVGTKIYLFGGHNRTSRKDIIQVFDTTNNTIQTLSTTLPSVAYGIGTAAVGTKIYLFGGYDDNSSKNTIQVFDTTNNTIQTLSTTLPENGRAIGAAAVGTKIYLFGGHNGNYLNAIRVFDTTNNTIQTLSTTLSQAAYDIGTAAVGTKIYLFGGYYKNGIINTINQFIVDVPLSSNDIIVTQEYYSRTFKIMKAPTEVEVAVKYVYKGDQNLAKFIDAYLYDGANWVNVNTGATA